MIQNLSAGDITDFGHAGTPSKTELPQVAQGSCPDIPEPGNKSCPDK